MMAAWRQELAGNPRLRVGLALVLGVLLTWGLLAAEDLIKAREQGLQRERSELQRLRQLARERFWSDQRSALRALDAAWRERSWSGPSEGQVQAQFQDWLRTELQAGGLKTRELQVSLPRPDQGGDAGPRRLRARAADEANPQGLHELLLRLRAAPGLTRVERLNVRLQPGAQAWVEIELEALVLGQAAAASEGAP